MKRTLIVLKNRLVNNSFVDLRLNEISDFEELPLVDRVGIQKQKLQNLLVHAANHIPFYAEEFRDLHILQDGVIDPCLFRAIPILGKEDIRNNFQKLTSDDLKERHWFKNHTGGSTGEPVEFIQDRYFDDCSIATAQLEFQWAGKKKNDTHIKLWGSQEDILLGGLTVKSRLGNLFSERMLLNCFLMSPDLMEKYARIIQSKRSVFIEAYADSAYEISRYFNKNGIVLNNITGMVTSAGTLYPFMREEIETTFRCRITNRYGSREMGNIACEKEPGRGLDVAMFTHLVEVLDERGEPCQPGQEGELIITSLTNYAMPLIRYRIGDRAVVKNYSEDGSITCTQLENVTGRAIEVFRKRDGSVVSSVFFMHFLGVVNYRKWLEKFQIIQLNYDEIFMKMVVSQKPSPEDLLAIETDLKRVMGAECQVKIEIVDEIPKLPSGKYQYTRSLVKAS